MVPSLSAAIPGSRAYAIAAPCGDDARYGTLEFVAVGGMDSSRAWNSVACDAVENRGDGRVTHVLDAGAAGLGAADTITAVIVIIVAAAEACTASEPPPQAVRAVRK
jgi:hypothetical protein